MRTSEIATAELWRCCIQTVLHDPGPDVNGRAIVCHYCGGQLTFERGAWRDLDLEQANRLYSELRS